MTKFPGISLLIKILPTIATLIGRILLAMGPIGWIITAVGLLAIGFKLLYERSETFRNIIDTAMAAIKSAISGAARGFEAFYEVIGGIFEKVVEGALWLWDVLFGNSVFPDLLDAFGDFFSAVGDIFTGIATFFTETIPNAAQALFNWLTENWKLILPILTGPLGLAIVLITENWDTIKGLFSAVKDWVIDVFGNAWGFIKDKIVSPIGDARDRIREFFGEGGPFRSFFSGIKDWVIDKFGAAWGFVKDKILDPIADARDRVREIFGEGGPVRNFFGGIKDWVINTWSSFWGGVKDKIISPIGDAKDRIFELFGEGGPIRNFFGGIKDWVIGTWSTFWGGVQEIIVKPIRDAKDAIKGFFDFEGEGGPIKKAFTAAVSGIASIWDSIQNIARAPINFVIREVYNNGLRKAFNLLPGVTLAPADEIAPPSVSKATGGVLPGWSPGKDIHHFVSPTAGRLNLSGGEAIMRPEFTRAVGGESGVNRLNALARSNALWKVFGDQSHASGGVVSVDGEPMSTVAAKQLALAKKLYLPTLRVIQGSYQAASSYSGTSHTGGGVADTFPGVFSAQSALRKVGFAAWARNIPGAAYAGSGAHIHAVSRIDPASAGHAQLSSFARGEDGLGGPDYGPNPPMLSNLGELLGGMTINASTGSVAQVNPGEEEKEGWLDRVKNILEIIPTTYKNVKSMFDEGGYFPQIAMASAHVGSDIVQKMNDKIPDDIKVDNFPDIPMPDNPIPNPFSALFDRGGIAQGQTDVWLPKRTARPERVLSPDQTMLFERMVVALERQRSTGGQGGNGDINLNVQVPQSASARDVVDGIVYEMRRYNRGGRYQV